MFLFSFVLFSLHYVNGINKVMITVNCLPQKLYEHMSVVSIQMYLFVLVQWNIYPVTEKQDALLLPITSPNVYRFSK